MLRRGVLGLQQRPHRYPACLERLVLRIASFGTDVGESTLAAAPFTAADVFSIAGTVSADKVCGFNARHDLLRGLRALSKRPGCSLSSFQQGVVHSVIASLPTEEVKVNAASMAIETASATPTPPEVTATSPPILEAFEHAQKVFLERHTYDAKAVAAAVASFIADTSQGKALCASQLCSLLTFVVGIHFRDVSFAGRLSRRAAELAREQMDVHQACIMFAKLNQLGVSDSFTALVGRIENGGQSMTTPDCLYVVWGLQAAASVNATAGPLVNRVMFELASRIDQLTDHQLTAVLEVSASYDQRNTAPSKTFAVRATERAPQLDERDLLSVMTSLHSMKLNDAKASKALLDRAAVVSQSMDFRLVDRYVDIASVMPFAATDFMSVVLHRLSNEAGLLAPSQLVAVLNAVASYPPAKGSPAAVAIACAAALRSESFDRDMLISALLGLVEMGYLGDDIWLLAERLAIDKFGFREAAEVEDFLSFLTPESVQTQRAVDCLSTLITTLMPAITPDVLGRIRQRLEALGLDSTKVLRQQSRPASMRRDLPPSRHGGQSHQDRSRGSGGGNQRPPQNNRAGPGPSNAKKKPFSLNAAMWDMD